MFFQLLPTFANVLGRLQPSKTTIRKTLGTPGVELSGYPRKVLHCYTSNSTRGQMRAELWLPPLCVWLSLILSLSIVRECLSLLPPCLHSLSLSLGRSSHLTPRKPLLLHSTPQSCREVPPVAPFSQSVVQIRGCRRVVTRSRSLPESLNNFEGLARQ